jgi:hypothetical protein
MINLIIGLCFGIASAMALVVMWRMAERLRREVRARDEKPAQPADTACSAEIAEHPR